MKVEGVVFDKDKITFTERGIIYEISYLPKSIGETSVNVVQTCK
jgi:hypothetical protein